MRDDLTVMKERLLVWDEHEYESALIELEQLFPRSVTVPYIRTQKLKKAFGNMFKRGGWLVLERRPTPLMHAVEYAMATYCKNTGQVQIVKTALGDRTYRVEFRWFDKRGGRKRKEREGMVATEASNITEWYRSEYKVGRRRGRRGSASPPPKWKTIAWWGLPLKLVPLRGNKKTVVPKRGKNARGIGNASVLPVPTMKRPTMKAWVLTLPKIGEKSSVQGMVTFLRSRRGLGHRFLVAEGSAPKGTSGTNPWWLPTAFGMTPP